ncbi:MAG: hypothetical protein QGF67_15130 [Lentisphaeria bacterium]|nr:hypothetical protein [Lentisphaeria bacterium]
MFKRLPLFAAMLLLSIGTTMATSEREISKLVSEVERAQKKVSSTVDRMSRLTSEIEFLESKALDLHGQLESKAEMANEAYNRTERLQLIRALQRDQRALAKATTHIEHQQAHLTDAESRITQRLGEMNAAHKCLAAAMGIEYEPMVIKQLLPPEPVVETADPPSGDDQLEAPLTGVPEAADPIEDAPPAPRPISIPEPAVTIEDAPPAPAERKPIVWQVLEPTAPKPLATVPKPPETAAPEAAAPEAAAPEAAAPEAAAPEAAAPEAAAPPQLKPKPIVAIGLLPVNSFESIENVVDDPDEPPIDDAPPIDVVVAAEDVPIVEDIPAGDDAPRVAVIDGDEPGDELDNMPKTVVVDTKPDAPVVSTIAPQPRKKRPPKKFVYTFNPEATAGGGTGGPDGKTLQLDNFAHIHTWAIDKSGSVGNVWVDNNRLILAYTVNLPAPKNKCIISRQMRETLSDHEAIIIDVEQESAAPARIAMAIVARDNKEYYESTTVTLKPGMNKSLTFDLTNDNFKCEASDWLHTASVREVDRILKVMFLVYVRGEGRTILSDLRSRPAQ